MQQSQDEEYLQDFCYILLLALAMVLCIIFEQIPW